MINRWNTAVEQQAFGRVFRIGQTKETSMISTTMCDTIEDRMLEKKSDKDFLINGVMQPCSVKK